MKKANRPVGFRRSTPVTKVVRLGKRTPGGWGAEKFRSSHQAGPSRCDKLDIALQCGWCRAEKGRNNGIIIAGFTPS